MNAIINANIYDFERYKANQYLLFDERIIEVGDMKDYEDMGHEVVDATGHLVMPSLVNGHNHIYSTFARGIPIDYDPHDFQDILDQLWWRMDAQHNLESIYYSGIVNGVESLRNGVTTMIDHHASGLDIIGSLKCLKEAVCDEVGLRGIFCFETSDRFDIDECIRENLEFVNTHKSQVVAGLFGMHAAMSLSDESLDKIKAHIGTMPIHIHIAESGMDEQISVTNYGKRVIHRLDRYGLLNKKSLLAHCLFINEEEAAIVAKRGCQVVLNVTSNMNNGVGLPDYLMLKKAGIRIMVGNDGIATGMASEWLNMYYAMHLKYGSPTSFGFTDLIDMIQETYAYASDLLGCQLGRLRPGYEADLLMIPYEPPTPITNENAFAHLYFGLGHSFKPRHVWCRGIHKVNDYEVAPAIMEKYKSAFAVSKSLWERIGSEPIL